MKLGELANQIGAKIVSGHAPDGTHIDCFYAGDRISDLLNHACPGTLLVSTLDASHLLRVAELMDAPAVCLTGGNEPTAELKAVANAQETFLIVSPADLASTCSRLSQALGNGQGGGV